MIRFAAFALLVCAAALVIRPLGKEYALAVSLAGAVTLACFALDRLVPVFQQLESLGSDVERAEETIRFGLRLTGTALLTEIACGVCRQAGEENLADQCAFLGKIVMTGMTLPVLAELLSLLRSLFLSS